METVLLAAALATMLVGPRRLPLWAGPAAAASIGLVTTVIPWSVAGDTFDLLASPLAFLIVAVPLAVLLDQLGLFSALAALVDGGRHLVAWLWVLAAAVTALLNLDAAVVLLTPLYIRIARRHHLDVEALAFQPALLACLASSPLPVSNLTNLIAAEHAGLGVGEFLAHMALPTVAACAVGWIAYRRCFRVEPTDSALDEPVDRAAIRRGLPIVAFVVIGFTLGDVIGVPAWCVAALASIWAAAIVRRWPWRVVPVEAVVVAASLSVLVLGATPHLHLDALLDGDGRSGRAVALAFGSVGSVATNNLPAVIAALPTLGGVDQVWALLIGANIAPALVITASLSGLLWRDTSRRMGVDVGAGRYTSVGLRVGLPALLVAGGIIVLA